MPIAYLLPLGLVPIEPVSVREIVRRSLGVQRLAQHRADAIAMNNVAKQARRTL